MRRPGRHHPAASSSLPAAAASTTATPKTWRKMTWKHAVTKIRGRQKLSAQSAMADNPENRKSRATTAVVAIDIETGRSCPPSKPSLLSKKRPLLKIGRKRSKGVALFDSVQTKNAKRAVASNSNRTADYEALKVDVLNGNNVKNNAGNSVDQKNGVIQCLSTAAVISLPVSSTQSYAGKIEQHARMQPSDIHESPSIGSGIPSPLSADCSEKKVEAVSRKEMEMSNSASEVPNCSAQTNSIRELDEDEKRAILVDFDAGMLPHEIEEKYGISKLQIADVLSNRISIYRRQVTNWSDVYALKRRRTVYVRLNMQMWEYFCQCRDQQICLNGRQLKEHALKIANELGLHSFKASEGWLDSFKRRHCIDLKTMTGKPVFYEVDVDEGKLSNDDGLEIRISRSATPKLLRDNPTSLATTVLDANKFLMDATDAAVLASASNDGMASSTQATAGIQSTAPLDIQRFLPTQPVGNEQTIIPSAAVNVSEISAAAIQALVETCCCRVNEVEVSQAVDTLRAYVVSNNINLLPVLVELQKGLAAIAAQRTPSSN